MGKNDMNESEDDDDEDVALEKMALARENARLMKQIEAAVGDKKKWKRKKDKDSDDKNDMSESEDDDDEDVDAEKAAASGGSAERAVGQDEQDIPQLDTLDNDCDVDSDCKEGEECVYDWWWGKDFCEPKKEEQVAGGCYTESGSCKSGYYKL